MSDTQDTLETHIAIRKIHRCDLCGKRIPLNSRYFASNGGEHREHANCELFLKEPVLPGGFNQNRRIFKDE